ncbi:MAG: hypothetical protein COU27_01445 [Candidatus Levybacteria bacterium CG10_big_fil_rev_8_21_14_0_10_36_7]|nr:MAG: hypothetical protein COU27_01445 [Candidatus Levybacteria bacterium CG10_big_fil_rev_8_21_14_0_10_36_7]
MESNSVEQAQPYQPIEQQPPQVSIVPNEPKKPSAIPKILMLFVLIIVVMILSSGGTYLTLKSKITPTPTPPVPITEISSPTLSPDLYTEETRSATANWQTYTNRKYGYSIKYPNDWKIQEKDNLQGLALFILTIYGPSQNTLLDIWVNNMDWQQAENELKGKAKQISLNGIMAYEEKVSKTSRTYTFPSKVSGQIVQILFSPSPKSPLEEIKALDQILSTFKFIEPSPTSNAQISDAEKKLIDNWILKNNLNEFGDPKDTMYAGGTPLFDERTGKTIDKYDYILQKHPDRPWNI